jgi:cytochrome c
MKRTFLILGICAVITACGGGTEKTAENTSAGEVASTEVTTETVDSAAIDTPAETPAEAPATEPAAPAAEPKKEVKEEPKKETAKVDPDIKAGEGLISKSDCMACHKADQRLVGPGYNEIAAKYPSNAANIQKLADKIISGGSGNWGEIPMTPHPTVSNDDAKKMVKYILSIK